MKDVQLRNIALMCICFVMLVTGAGLLIDEKSDNRVEANERKDSEDGWFAAEISQSGRVVVTVANDDPRIGPQIPVTDQAVNVDEQVTEDVTEPYIMINEGNAIIDNDRWRELRGDYSGVAQLIIPPLSDGEEIAIEDDYMNKSLKIMIDNCSDGDFDIGQFQRIAGNIYFIGDVIPEIAGDAVKKVKVVSKDSDVYEGRFRKEITVKFDHIYAYRLHQYADACVVDCSNPHDVYDCIMVVDPGHGGIDVGCNSTGGKCLEKDIAINIAKKLKEKLDKTSIKVYYTRLGDDSLALRERVGLANDLNADMLISLHCNFYERYWVPGVNGVETLYSSVNKEKRIASKKLATDMLDGIVDTTGMRRRNVVNRKKDLYILRNSEVPATIIEMGYLSDKNDLKMLTNKKKIKKMVNGLYNGIIKAYYNMYGKVIE